LLRCCQTFDLIRKHSTASQHSHLDPSPTMTPFSNGCGGACNDWMQSANCLWDPEDDIGFSDYHANAFMMQASSGMLEIPSIVSSNSGSLIPNRVDSYTPRSDAPLEQIQDLFRKPNIDTEPQHLLSSTANPNTEDQQTSDSTVQDEDTQEDEADEPVYFADPEASNPRKQSCEDSGPSSAEWVARKNEIKYWYIEKNYTCDMTKDEMAKKDFHATSVS